MSENILCVKNIKKSFGGVHALKGVDLTIKKGETHCLAGENGCGKSTIIKVISGFYKPDEGTIEIDGKEYTMVRHGILRPQEFTLITQTKDELVFEFSYDENTLKNRHIISICRFMFFSYKSIFSNPL